MSDSGARPSNGETVSDKAARAAAAASGWLAVAIVLSLNVGLKATLLSGVFCYITGFGLVATLAEPATESADADREAPSGARDPIQSTA